MLLSLNQESCLSQPLLLIGKMTEADLVPVDHILMTAYKKNFSFRDQMRRYLAFEPEGWFVAEREGVLGVAGAILYGTVAQVGMVAVDPVVHRQGIGMALMKQLLPWMDENGCTIALLDASEEGGPLYAKLGFVDSDKTLMLRRDQPMDLAEATSHFAGSLAPAGLAELAEISEYDTPRFGACRQRILADLLGR